MTCLMVDVEADGPIPGDYSMVCFGAIVLEPSLDKTFYGKLKPVSEKWITEALAVSGFRQSERITLTSCRMGFSPSPNESRRAKAHPTRQL